MRTRLQTTSTARFHSSWHCFTHTVQTEGGDRANTEWISRSKLRVETRLKLLAKWDPKRYGDKITQEHVGADGGGIDMNVTLNFVTPK